jgi:hypothetical protein
LIFFGQAGGLLRKLVISMLASIKIKCRSYSLMSILLRAKTVQSRGSQRFFVKELSRYSPFDTPLMLG